MIDLSGKVAVVTGASRGIGRDTAAMLHKAGASLALLARSADQLESLANELGDRATAFQADISSADVAETFKDIEESLGPIDILVNNAGVTRDGVLVRMSEDDWDVVMDINLKGVFHTTKAVTRGMMKRRSGRIINITSVVGVTGNRGQANYAASKAGIIGFTKSIAKELGSRNVLVNALAPGFIDTDMTRELPQEARDALTSQIPLGRLGTGADIAGTVAFLASDLAGYITGQTIVVDGGMIA